MNSEELIGGDYLTATHQALGLVAPDLQHHILAILRRGPATSGPSAIGQSIFHQYPVTMRALDAEAILDALKRVEEACGYNKTFFDRQINLLVCSWGRHAERLRTAGERIAGHKDATSLNHPARQQ